MNEWGASAPQFISSIEFNNAILESLGKLRIPEVGKWGRFRSRSYAASMNPKANQNSNLEYYHLRDARSSSSRAH